MDILNQKEIEDLRSCGRILSESLSEVLLAIKPGISSIVLDQIAERAIRQRGAKPSFKNYHSGNEKPFPASLCVSINSEVVHGIPSNDKIIKEGDVVGLDLGAVYNGIYTDMSETVIAGKVQDQQTRELVETAKEALKVGISQAIKGNTVGDVSHAIESFVKSRNFSVVKALVGHGIGRSAHTDPQIPNYGAENSGPKLQSGTAIAIEPMIVSGGFEVRTADDGWTVLTVDGANSAHFEHTILITDTKPEIITKRKI